MKMRARFGAGVIAGILTALVALSGWASASPPADQLVIAQPADFLSLDPAVSPNASDQTIMALAYDRLSAIDPRNGNALPELARSWSMSPNAMQWTFKLRDAKFQDGSPVTAAAVAYSFQRIRKVGRATSESLFWLKNVEAVDKLTVRFDLSIPFPVLPQLLAVPGFAIVNPAVVQSHEVNGDNGSAWLSEHTAGSGDYRLLQWDRGQRLMLERTAKTGPRLVVFQIIPDASSRRVQLARGDVDLVPGVGAREAPEWMAMPGVSLETSHVPNTLYYLTLNTTRKPLSDARVRRAIALAIDYTGLRKNILGGNAVLLAGPIPPGFPAYDASLQAHQNIAAAKKLLADAGFQSGLTLHYVVSAQGPVSQYVQANLNAIGINAVFQQLAPSALDGVRTSGDFDIMYDGFTMDYPDPSIIMNLVFPTGGPVNYSRYSNPAVDRLLNEAFAETNLSKRYALYDQAARIIMHDQPIVPLFAPDTILAHRSSVVGLHLNPYQNYVYDLAGVRKR